MPISSPNPMFDHLLESSHRDDSNKWSNIGLGEEITHVELTEVHFMRHTYLVLCKYSSLFPKHVLTLASSILVSQIFDSLCFSAA